MDIQLDFEKLINTNTSVKNATKNKEQEGLNLYNSFSELIKNQMVDANTSQLNFEDMNKKLVLGEVSNVHDVMIAGQKANMALEFTMQLRSLLLNAYTQLTQLR